MSTQTFHTTRPLWCQGVNSLLIPLYQYLPSIIRVVFPFCERNNVLKPMFCRIDWIHFISLVIDCCYFIWRYGRWINRGYRSRELYTSGCSKNRTKEPMQTTGTVCISSHTQQKKTSYADRWWTVDAATMHCMYTHFTIRFQTRKLGILTCCWPWSCMKSLITCNHHINK